MSPALSPPTSAPSGTKHSITDQSDDGDGASRSSKRIKLEGTDPLGMDTDGIEDDEQVNCATAEVAEGTAEDATVEDTAADDAVVEDSAVEDSAVGDATVEDSAVEDSVAEEPSNSEDEGNASRDADGSPNDIERSLERELEKDLRAALEQEAEHDLASEQREETSPDTTGEGRDAPATAEDADARAALDATSNGTMDKGCDAPATAEDADAPAALDTQVPTTNRKEGEAASVGAAAAGDATSLNHDVETEWGVHPKHGFRFIRKPTPKQSYSSMRDSFSRLHSGHGCMFPCGYRLDSSIPGRPWICGVRDCRMVFSKAGDLGRHITLLHYCCLFNDNCDGTFSVVGSYSSTLELPIDVRKKFQNPPYVVSIGPDTTGTPIAFPKLPKQPPQEPDPWAVSRPRGRPPAQKPQSSSSKPTRGPAEMSRAPEPWPSRKPTTVAATVAPTVAAPVAAPLSLKAYVGPYIGDIETGASPYVRELLAMPKFREIRWNSVKGVPFEPAQESDAAALLVQVTGVAAPTACTRCQKNSGPFAGCVVLSMMMSLKVGPPVDCCANCLYGGFRDQCSVRMWNFDWVDKQQQQQQQHLERRESSRATGTQPGSNSGVNGVVVIDSDDGDSAPPRSAISQPPGRLNHSRLLEVLEGDKELVAHKIAIQAALRTNTWSSSSAATTTPTATTLGWPNQRPTNGAPVIDMSLKPSLKPGPKPKQKPGRPDLVQKPIQATSQATQSRYLPLPQLPSATSTGSNTEIEEWELDQAQGSVPVDPQDLALAGPYVSTGCVIPVVPSVLVRMVTLSPGMSMDRFSSPRDATVMFFVIHGKVRVHFLDQPSHFFIGAHGMLRVNAGRVCNISNRGYTEAALHLLQCPAK